MTWGQRFMLLFSLLFFFGTVALVVVDFGGKKTAGLVTGREQESVLHYPEDLRASAATIPCYTGETYDTLVRQAGKNGYTVISSGQLSDGDTMKIWAKDSGDYFVIVEGPDQSGAVEGCQVTEGWNLQSGEITTASAPPSVPAVPETAPETMPAEPEETMIESPPSNNPPEDPPPSESSADRESRAPLTDTDPADPEPAQRPESDPAPRSE